MIYPKCSNFKYILGSLKRFWWVAALYFICLFFALPFRMMVSADNWNKSISASLKAAQSGAAGANIFKIDIFNFSWGAESLAFIVVPLLITALIFSYINKKSAVDTIHSLPVKRERLYLLNVVSGFILYAAPLVVIAVLNAIVISALGFWGYIGVSSLFYWFGCSILFLSVFYSLFIFFTMCTGNVAAMAALTCFFGLLPVLVFILFNLTLSQWFFGFTEIFARSGSSMVYMSPFVRCFSIAGSVGKSLGAVEAVVYIILTAAALYLGMIAYKKRKSEKAGDVLSFKISIPIVKYSIMVCGAIVFGSILERISNDNGVMLLVLGYIIGAALSYMIVQSIIYKDVRSIKKNIKSMAVFILIIFVLSLSLLFDIYGYQKRVPVVADVKTVYFKTAQMVSFSTDTADMPGYKTADNIKLLTDMHKEILSKKFDQSYSMFKNRVSVTNYSDVLSSGVPQTVYMGFGPIEYALNSGGTIRRTYSYDFATLKKYLPKILASKEGKENWFLIFNSGFKTPDKMEVASISGSARVTSQNAKDIALVISAIKQDILNDPMPVDFQNADIGLGQVYFDGVLKTGASQAYSQSSYGSYGITIKSYYKNTIDALNSFGITLSPLKASDIASMEITSNGKNAFYKISAEKSSGTVLKETSDTLAPYKITDSGEISEVFSKLKVQPPEFGSYFGNSISITMTLKNSKVVDGVFTVDNDKIPDFILKHFNISKQP